MELLADIRKSSMSRQQMVAVSVAIAILIMDGFDITTMAFAATSISREWDIEPAQLGVILSGSLFGMAGGSVLLAPLADRFGRRPVILIALLVMGAGMALTALSPNPEMVLVFRILTGVGAGAMISNLVVVVSEYASDRRRSTLTAVQAAGYPIGSTLVGVIAGGLLPMFGWRSLFVVGAAVTLALFALGMVWLPESLDWLLTKQPAGALQRANHVLTQQGRSPLEHLEETATYAGGQNGGLREIIRPGVLFRSVMVWIGYGLLISGFYFVNTWTPRVITSVSGSDERGVLIGIVANAGGILGVFIFAALVSRFAPAPVLIATLIAGAAAFAAFSAAFDFLMPAFLIAGLLGLLTTGGIAGFQAYGPHIYSARARATGLGLMIGIGRVIAIVSPILVGYMLEGGIPAERIYLIFAAPMAAAAVAVAAAHVSLSRA